MTEDFEVVKSNEIQVLKNKIKELELEVLKVKRAAATGAWCRRDHIRNNPEEYYGATLVLP